MIVLIWIPTDIFTRTLRRKKRGPGESLGAASSALNLLNWLLPGSHHSEPNEDPQGARGKPRSNQFSAELAELVAPWLSPGSPVGPH